MKTFSQHTLPVVALGAALLFTGACNAAANGSGEPAAAPSAAAPIDNTAEICRSGGESARTAVLELFGKLAGQPSPAELTSMYQTTFGRLRDDLGAAAGRATDPAFAAVLTGIATEAGEIATAGDPESVDMQGFQDALAKLETYCPSGSPGASAAPGGVADGAVGAKGSGCELPVTFAVAPKWEPKSVAMTDDDPLAELARKGDLRMVCEISAKRAGLTGFLRVWTGPASADPRTALKSLLKGEKTRKVGYQPGRIGKRDGVELEYQLYSELMEEYSDRRAFAVATPDAAVVVELSGLDSDDPAVRAAYERAKDTLTVKT